MKRGLKVKYEIVFCTLLSPVPVQQDERPATEPGPNSETLETNVPAETETDLPSY